MTILKFSSNIFGAITPDNLTTNPDQGRKLAELLRAEFQALNYETEQIITEMNWGWCFFMQYYRQQYMIGTLAYNKAAQTGDAEGPASRSVEYFVQFDKTRTLKERLFSRNKFAPDEPIIDLTAAILKFKISDMIGFSKEIDV